MQDMKLHEENKLDPKVRGMTSEYSIRERFRSDEGGRDTIGEPRGA